MAEGPRIFKSVSRVTEFGMPLAQYRHEHPGDGDPLEGEPESERPSAEGAPADRDRVLTVQRRA